MTSMDIVDWLRSLLVAAVSIVQAGVGIAYVSVDDTIPQAAPPPPVAASEPSPHVSQAASSRSMALTVIALASPCVTLLIGALAIASKHRITEHQLDLGEQHDKRDKEFEARRKAIEVRLALLEKGIPCEHEDCPVIQVATGQRPWDELPPFRRAQCPTSPPEGCIKAKEKTG